VSATRARSYVRNVVPRTDGLPGQELETALIDEGYALEFSPLLSVDGRIVDAVISFDITQVEKMVPVMLDVPSAAAPRGRVKIEVPQISQFQFRERFRWPVDQVLLVGLGMVPFPAPAEGTPLIPGLPLPLPGAVPRADVLVFVESKGKAGQGSRFTSAGQPEAASYRGRY
jgi:hypothetical protein